MVLSRKNKIAFQIYVVLVLAVGDHTGHTIKLSESDKIAFYCMLASNNLLENKNRTRSLTMK